MANFVVLAAVAHPDDIEFLFSGTLLLLREAGCAIHMWNLADGGCGSLSLGREEIARLRGAEAACSAKLANAQIYPPLFPDLGVFYDQTSLASVAATIRTIRPHIILTHSASDYMEDHQNVCRLVTTAVFSRAMPNFISDPPCEPYGDQVRIYHAPPHGLRDGLGEAFTPDFLVDVTSTMETKIRMLACHESQFSWLGGSQEMNSPVDAMREQCRVLASGTGREFVEGWRRHSHLGFCACAFDPLSALLRDHLLSPNTNLNP